MADMLGQIPRPDWRKITATIQAEKLLDGNGNKPNAERVRQTWFKVRKDVAAARAGKKPKPQNTAPPIVPEPEDLPPLPATKWTPTKLK